MSLIAVHGENFSGRTNLLRNEARGTRDAPGVYVGPEIYNYVSALCANVEAELALHRACARGGSYESTPSLVDVLYLEPLLQRNPFALSGGQQAAVALAAASVMGKNVVAVDSCLEQLDLVHRHAFLRWAQLQHPRWFIADNRIDEVVDGVVWSERVTLSRQPTDGAALPLRPLAPPKDSPAPGRLSTPLELVDVHFAYHPRHPVLRGVSIQLPPGLYVLEGANGAGKSTLARLLCGVLRPANGCIRVNGRDARTWRSPGQLAGYHFQNPDLQLFSATVKAELTGSRRFESDQQLRDFAYCFGLHRALDCHPLDLPFVGRKRVALAATMAMPAPWLILDEPTLGQDSSSMAVITNLIDSFVAAGRGVIIISHSTLFKKRLGGSTIRLEDGRVTLANP